MANNFDESKHRRGNKGTPLGGKFIDKNSTGIPVSLKPSEGYIDRKRKELRDMVNKEGIKMSNSQHVEAALSLAFREDAVDMESTYAMLEHMEKSGVDTETALRVMSYQGKWTGSTMASHEEWFASQELGSEVGIPKGVIEDLASRHKEVSLTSAEILAYKARTEFTQTLFDEKYPDGLDVYRGVKGKYATKIKKKELPLFSGSPVSVKIPTYSLSSYSDNHYDAVQFSGVTKRGSVMKGLVVKRRITGKDVWPMPRQIGVGSPIKFIEDRGEIVLFDSDGFQDIEVIQW